MSPPPAVLARYAPVLDGLTWAPVGGGFSGANVFRGAPPDGDPVFALKAWQPEVPPDRVARVHAWVGRAAHLPFVPSPVPTNTGDTFALNAGRVWDVCRWMPGAPSGSATEAEVKAACAAVARLHAAWPIEGYGPCPAVRSRLRAISDFRAYFGRGPDIPPGLPSSIASLLRRGWESVARVASAAESALRGWEHVSLPMRPCVRDLRGAHVLFTGAEISGIIDFGASAVDHPAVDLARLLGDLAGSDEVLVAAGVSGYRNAGGESVPGELVRLLDQTGVVGSLVGWLLRLGPGSRIPDCPGPITGRLEHLLTRLAEFPPF